MNRACDLHTHSIFSDGTCTPAQIIQLAVEQGLTAVALTDHNTVSGLPDFFQAARGMPLEAVAGIEISAMHGEREVHILGLYLPPSGWGILQDSMVEINRRKEESNRMLVQALKENGYPVDYEALAARTPNHHINRGHIGAELVRMGWAASVRDALYGILSEETGYYRPPERMTAMETLRLICQAGGVPVLAHPFLNLTEGELRQFLPVARDAGLAGMETVYSLYDDQTALCARNLAREMGLKESGGSDFHGTIKPDIALGTGRGNLYIPHAFHQGLKTG